MKQAWGRLAAACVAVVGAAILATGGSAGPRAADATFDAFPGPGQVTLRTADRLQGDVQEHERHDAHARHVPSALPGRRRRLKPTPVERTRARDSDDDPTRPGEWICDFGQPGPNAGPLASDGRVEGADAGDRRATARTASSRTAAGRSRRGERRLRTERAFPQGGKTVTATLLASNAGGSELLKAGGYETGPRRARAERLGSLQTNPVVSLDEPRVDDGSASRRSRSRRAPRRSRLATTITETAGNAGTRRSASRDLGTNCGPTYIDADFAPPAVYPRVPRGGRGAALPKNYTITTVSHNGGPPGARARATPNGFCVVSITLDNTRRRSGRSSSPRRRTGTSTGRARRRPNQTWAVSRPSMRRITAPRVTTPPFSSASSLAVS